MQEKLLSINNEMYGLIKTNFLFGFSGAAILIFSSFFFYYFLKRKDTLSEGKKTIYIFSLFFITLAGFSLFLNSFLIHSEYGHLNDKMHAIISKNLNENDIKDAKDYKVVSFNQTSDDRCFKNSTNKKCFELYVENDKKENLLLYGEFSKQELNEIINKKTDFFIYNLSLHYYLEQNGFITTEPINIKNSFAIYSFNY